MYKVKFGGKNGKTVTLQESPDMVAIRTKDNKDIEEVQLSREGREMLNDTTEVVKFAEAGITVRRVQTDLSAAAPPAGEGFESTRKELSGPPSEEEEVVAEVNKRDATRTALKQEENIRFAGRVLQDADSGEVMLYTENFFVKFKDSVKESECLAIIDKYQLQVKSKLAFAPNSYFVQAKEGTGLEVFNIAEQILNEKPVEYCHPELVQERRSKSIHPLQWHLAKTAINGKTVDAHCNIEAAWKHTRGKGITVAIIDDGVDTTHPEFAGRIVHPFDATANLNNADPKHVDDKHGTACAGMACAAGLKDGASGTAPEAFLMPIRLRSGLGSMSEANAFAWAADHGADVISCSWGPADGEWWNPADPVHNRLSVLPDSTRLSLEYALNKGRKGKGCVILFAAGNGNEDAKNDGYVSYPGVITVAATNDTGTRSVFSDYGDSIWAAFPSNDFGWKAFQHPAPLSEGLRTTDRTQKLGYQTGDYTNAFGGTSGACPGMAGVVALILAANPDLTPPEVKEIIRNSCTRVDEKGGEYDSNGHSIYYGYGRIDAAKAVENAKKAKEIPTGPSIEGSIRFGKIGEMRFQHNLLLGNIQPANKVLGFSLKIKPPVKGLTMRYRANIPGLGIVENKAEGDYVGTANGRQRLIGFAVALEGAPANSYEVAYSARMQGQQVLQSAKNGAFCGSDKKSGKTIEAISITVTKK